MRNVHSVISNNKSTHNRILIKYYLLFKLLKLTGTQNLVRHITHKREEILLTNRWITWLVKIIYENIWKIKVFYQYLDLYLANY